MVYTGQLTEPFGEMVSVSWHFSFNIEEIEE